MSVKLKFTPYAYQKVLFLRDHGPTEVSGFCITHEEYKDVVCDFMLVKQECSAAYTEMDKQGLIDYFSDRTDEDIPAGRCFRVWLHTHPGDSPSPSSTDWEQFNDLRKSYPWFCMLIIARGGAKFGQMFFSDGPGGTCNVEWDVDWDFACEEVEFNDWVEEYELNVSHIKFASSFENSKTNFTKGYEKIDWKERWEETFHDNNREKWVEPEFPEELSEEDLFELVKDKDINAMTPEEYEFYATYVDEDE